MIKLSVAVMFGLWLTGCGAQDLGGEEFVSQIEQDFGGPSGLMEFFESHTEEEIQRALEPYGEQFQPSQKRCVVLSGNRRKHFCVR